MNLNLKLIHLLILRFKTTYLTTKPIFMRKPSNKNERYQIAITANVEEPCMLQVLVETLAESKPNLPNIRKMHRGWKVLASSSIEARISGGLNLSDRKTIEIPFVTCFLFTCIKTRGKYELKWSNSLS